MKLISAATFLAIIIFCIVNHRFFSMEYLSTHMPSKPMTATCYSLLIYALKSLSVMFPKRAIEIAVGAVFPKGWAFVINLTGSALGFAIAYFMGKALGEEYVDKLVYRYPKFKAIVECQNSSTVFISFFLRTMTFIPIDVASMYMGASKSSFGKYMLGSVIGIIPSVIIGTFMGQYFLDPFSKGFILSFALLAVMSVISLICYLLYIRKHARPHSDT